VLKSYRKQFNILCVLVDGGALLLSFALAYFVRARLLVAWDIGPLREPVFGRALYLPVFLLCGAAILLALFALGAYRMTPGRPWHAVFAANVKAALLALVLILATAAALRLTYLSRAFVLLQIVLFVLLSTAGKRLTGRLFGARGRRGLHHRILVLVGCGTQARQMAESLLAHPEFGVSVRGFLVPEKACDEGERALLERQGVPCLGETGMLPDLLHREVVDGVVFAADSKALDRTRFEELCLTCEDVGVDVLLPVNPFPHLIARVKLERFEEFTLLHFTTLSHDAVALFAKRSLDLTASLAGLLLLVPLFLAVGIGIRVTSRGPVFFVQERVGLRGRRFRMVKFRTMVADAESRLQQVRHLNEADGPVFKVKADPRITPLGRLLRKASIDELPQLWNVLRGDMSLVGPRPPIPAEVEKYERWQRRRLSMRPGITCLWQVSGRSELDFDTWMKLDLQYIDNWSLGLDFMILAKTLPAVFSGRGAA